MQSQKSRSIDRSLQLHFRLIIEIASGTQESRSSMKSKLRVTRRFWTASRTVRSPVGPEKSVRKLRSVDPGKNEELNALPLLYDGWCSSSIIHLGNMIPVTLNRRNIRLQIFNVEMRHIREVIRSSTQRTMESSFVQVQRSKDTMKETRFWLERQNYSGNSNLWIAIPLEWTQKASGAVESSLTGKEGNGERRRRRFT